MQITENGIGLVAVIEINGRRDVELNTTDPQEVSFLMGAMLRLAVEANRKSGVPTYILKQVLKGLTEAL